MPAPRSPRPIPTAMLEGQQVKRRVPGRRPGPAEREEILRLWDAMSHDGRKLAYAAIRAAAMEDGVLPEGSTVLVRGKG